jgi:hypothetical protein
MKLGSDQAEQVSCVYKPTDRNASTELSDLVGGGGAKAPPLLGFSNLFLSLSFPCQALRPTFLIPLATKKIFI